MHQGCVIWLIGLENFNFNTYCDELFDSVPAGNTTSFLTMPDEAPKKSSALEDFYDYILHNLEEVEIIQRGAIIDATVNGEKFRYIIARLSPEEFADHVYNAPSDRCVVIAARPKGITKSEIEERFTYDDKLMVNATVPKTANLGPLVGKKHLWNKDCLKRTAKKALYDIVIGITVELSGSIVKAWLRGFNPNIF